MEAAAVAVANRVFFERQEVVEIKLVERRWSLAASWMDEVTHPSRHRQRHLRLVCYCLSLLAPMKR